MTLEQAELLTLLNRTLDILKRTINATFNPDLAVQAFILSDDIKIYIKKVRDDG